MDTQLLSVMAAATCPPAVALLPVSPPAGKHRFKADDFLEACNLLFTGLLVMVRESPWTASSSLQSQIAYFDSETSSLHWKFE